VTRKWEQQPARGFSFLWQRNQKVTRTGNRPPRPVRGPCLAQHCTILFIQKSISCRSSRSSHLSSSSVRFDLSRRAKNPITMAASNFVNVTSPQHFKDLLSADLNRVSCLNFWAPWAEPCAAFTKAVEGEATKFPGVLFLSVSLVLLRARLDLSGAMVASPILAKGCLSVASLLGSERFATTT
jgi:thiol-disulfide isomerase/thioredoxin